MSRRIAGIAGLIYVGAILVSAITFGDAPSIDSDVESIRSYLAGVGAAERVGGLLAALAIPFWALFVAGIIGTLRGIGEDDGLFWGRVAWFGAVTVLFCVILADVFLDILFFRDDAAGLDDAAVRLLWDGQFIAYSVMGIGVATLTAAVAVPSLLRHGAWPSWHAWFGLLVAVVALLGPFALLSSTDTGELLSTPTFPALLLWSLISAILLLRSPRDAVSDPSPR